MALVQYAPELTLREARDLYFRANHFGDDGGYGDAWVDFKLGPVPLPFPNTPARVRAVRYHDLHHVLTAYDTDPMGEFEISAWEIAAGCKGYLAAWQLNLGGLFAGCFVAPRRIVRAFLRGRHSETLYDRPLEELLASTVAAARESMGVERETPSMRVKDGALFGLALLAGLCVTLLTLPLFLLFLPLGLGTLLYRRTRAAVAAGGAR
jgi:hypothetical protein